MRSFALIILFVGLAMASVQLTLPSKCQCEKIKLSTDCKGFCKWNSNACTTLKCTEIKAQTDCEATQSKCLWSTTCIDYKDCTDFKTEATCDNAPNKFGCAWNGACKPFTKCADYKSGTTSCAAKSTLTTVCENNAAATGCQDKVKVDCTAFGTTVTQQKCDAADGCVWSSAKCSAFDKCQAADGNQTQCTKQSSCLYKENKCISKTCTDFTNANLCTFVPSFVSTTATACKWSSTKCEEAIDASQLTKENCGESSAQTYAWVDNKCTSCQSQGILISVMLCILVMFG